MSEQGEPVEAVDAEEVLIGELEPAENVRTLYVYDPRDDFLITIPAGAKVTFGYFNPASAGAAPSRFGGYSDGNGPGSQTMKTTALRVYEKAEKGNQIACFMGVSGFRDVNAVTKTIKTKKVTIETNYEDDGLGNNNFSRVQAAQPLAIEEVADGPIF